MKDDPRMLRDELRMVARGASHTHRMLRSRLAFLMVGTIGLDAVGTVLMYAFEHTRPGSGFHDLGGASNRRGQPVERGR